MRSSAVEIIKHISSIVSCCGGWVGGAQEGRGSVSIVFPAGKRDNNAE